MDGELFDVEGLTRDEVVLLRTLVQDRMEDRFRMVHRVADSMDIAGLGAVNDELRRLDVLRVKLKGEL